MIKDELILKGKLSLLEKEITATADRIAYVEKAVKELEDLRLEVKGLLLFMDRHYPEIKFELPEIIRKLK